ncbi:MAG: hypothetical protein ACREDR_22390 [Blastocatellia bacterium]
MADPDKSVIEPWEFFNESDVDDEFGHTEIVQTLTDVVRTVAPPFV